MITSSNLADHKLKVDLAQLLLMEDMISKKPASDAKMREKIYDLASSNGMIVAPRKFPDAYSNITDLDDITSSLEQRSSAMQAWADILADIAFRFPGLHVAAHHAANILVYEIRCKTHIPYGAGRSAAPIMLSMICSSLM
ncbi:hypothetical protein PMIN02_005533 [Paraphaeosphaeria minitans]